LYAFLTDFTTAVTRREATIISGIPFLKATKAATCQGRYLKITARLKTPIVLVNVPAAAAMALFLVHL
jgi:hypothetical protein